MKSLTIILLLICVNTLDQFVGAHPPEDHDHEHHHHHHHHPRYPPTQMQLTSCASKLDFLCLSRLNNVIETYKDNAAAILNKLKLDITDRIEVFESYKISNENEWILFVNKATIALNTQLGLKLAGDPPAATLSCAALLYKEILLFDTVKLNGVQNCIENSFVNYPTRNVSQLTTTAAAATNKICDCVSNITTCSSTGDKSAAKGCAEAAAANLNIASIQSQADTILAQVDTDARTKNTEYTACLNGLNITTDRQNLSTKINAC